MYGNENTPYFKIYACKSFCRVLTCRYAGGREPTFVTPGYRLLSTKLPVMGAWPARLIDYCRCWTIHADPMQTHAGQDLYKNMSKKFSKCTHPYT